jgi:hypothetical protein
MKIRKMPKESVSFLHVIPTYNKKPPQTHSESVAIYYCSYKELQGDICGFATKIEDNTLADG